MGFHNLESLAMGSTMSSPAATVKAEAVMVAPDIGFSPPQGCPMHKQPQQSKSGAKDCATFRTRVFCLFHIRSQIVM